MREIVYSTQYKKDLKKARKQGKDEAELDNVIRLLIEDTPLPEKYHDHELQGWLKGVRECHVNPDWRCCMQRKTENCKYYTSIDLALTQNYLENRIIIWIDL